MRTHALLETVPGRQEDVATIV